MKSFSIILALSVLLVSCNKDNFPKDLKYTIIAQSAMYGAGDEEINQQNTVIKNESDWNNLIDKMDSVNPESDNFTETDIDFSDFMVFACFTDVKSSGGYNLGVVDISENKKQIDVTLTPSDSLVGNTTFVITQPYVIVKVAKSKKDVVFD